MIEEETKLYDDDLDVIVKLQKKYLSDKKEPIYDMRKVFPEIESSIKITGDVLKVMNMEQFNCLMKNNKITEYGYDGEVQFLKIEYLFTIDDVINKIDRMMNKAKK